MFLEQGESFDNLGGGGSGGGGLISVTDMPDEFLERAHTPVDPIGDVFGSAPASPFAINEDSSLMSDEQRTQSAAAEISDIPRLRNTHVTNGYREGIAASKEKFLQIGFDDGYNIGAEFGLRVGQCIGTLEGWVHACRASSQSANQPLIQDSKADAKNQANSALHQILTTILRQAGNELDLQNLFSDKFFGADGAPSYSSLAVDIETIGQQDAAIVAASHPLVAKWTAIIHSLGIEFGRAQSRSMQGS